MASLSVCSRAASVLTLGAVYPWPSLSQPKPSASTTMTCCACVPSSCATSIVDRHVEKGVTSASALSSCSGSLSRMLGINCRSGFNNVVRRTTKSCRSNSCYAGRNRSQLGIRASNAQVDDPTEPGGQLETRNFEQKILAFGNDARKSVSVHILGAVAVGLLLFGIPSAQAVDALKTCSCLLKECRVELARCIADPGCAANVACLQTCNNRPDETQCQIACGDLFENKVVDQFNDCAVSRKGCVPQKSDEGTYPVPPPSALVQDFKTKDFKGKWFISSGLNRTFDTFDCQLHEFSATRNTVTGKLTWRISTPDGGFFTRSAVQNFVQDESQSGILRNHGNEFLHYQDDWYILASQIENKPDDFVFVYYRGKNDAWDGYGGSVIYTRSRTLPSSIIPKLTAAAKSVGLDFNKFTTTDNTCGPEPPLFARLEKTLEKGEQAIVKEVQELEQTVENAGKQELMLLGKGAQELKREEEELLASLGKEEKALLDELQMEASDIERLFGKAIPIRKLR
ncbi:hypothetical protein Mapa_015026 [Marchantia paleacea]|nr:hypothetical protein Mapa_015026 [Marchantia paleacea]